MSQHHQPELNAQLKQQYQRCLEVLQQAYISHSKGTRPLPPEESLALRSHISHLSQILTPDIQDAWPELSSVEKDYLAEQQEARKSDASLLGIAVLGPFAAPAVAARMNDKSADVQDKLLELGFNGMAMTHFAPSRSRLKVVDVPIKEGMPPELTKQLPLAVTEPFPKESLDVNSPAPKTGLTPQVAESLQYLAADARLVTEWWEGSNGDIGRLQTLMYKLGAGGRAELVVDIKSGGKIDSTLDAFSKSREGLKKAYDITQNLSHRLMLDTFDKNGDVDFWHFREILREIRKGEYIRPEEYAAMDYVREYMHRMIYMEDKLSGISVFPFTAESLKPIRTEAIKQFEEMSPYRRITPSEALNPKSTSGDMEDLTGRNNNDSGPSR